MIDADAHAWPEVYFGPKFGWLPFEPTPSFNDPGATGYAPNTNTGAPGSAPLGEALPAAPKGTGPGAGANQAQRTPPTTKAQSSSGGASGPRHEAWSPVLWLIPSILGWIAINAIVRRLRWRYRRGPLRDDRRDRQVLGRWADVSELLAWWGVARHPSETDDEFARRAADRIGRQLGEPSPWLVGGVLRMAGLAREATVRSRDSGRPPSRSRPGGHGDSSAALQIGEGPPAPDLGLLADAPPAGWRRPRTNRLANFQAAFGSSSRPAVRSVCGGGERRRPTLRRDSPGGSTSGSAGCRSDPFGAGSGSARRR